MTPLPRARRSQGSSLPVRSCSRAEVSMQSGERLQKAIANLGLASRRVAEAWIKAGRLSVNGEVATLGLRVRPDDQIRLDGRLVRRKAPGRSHKEAYIG